LADIFFKARLIEAWGRGTIKITGGCKKVGLPEPEFKEEFGGFAVYFYKDIYLDLSLKKMELNERQIRAVMFVKQNGKITNKKYQHICDTSERTATRDLSGLVSLEILEQIGTTGKGTEYVLRRHKDAKDVIKTP